MCPSRARSNLDIFCSGRERDAEDFIAVVFIDGSVVGRVETPKVRLD